MTNQLEDRLRAAFDAADDFVLPPSLGGKRVHRRVTVRGGVLVAAIAAATVLVVVGGVALLQSDGAGDVTGEPDVTTSVPAVTSTTIAAAASGTKVTIRVVEGGEGVTVVPRAVSASGDGLVALIEEPTGVWAWESPDGLDWTRLGALPVASESGLPLGFAGVGDLVQYNSELLAAGTLYGQPTANNTQGTLTAALWRSTDGGETWSLDALGAGFIGSVTETDDGPVAGGAVVRGAGSRAAVWQLTDSAEAIDLASAVGNDSEVSFVRALIESDLGLIAYVSTGTIAEADKADRVAAWVSTDGSTWAEADQPQPFGHGPMAVWRMPQGYFAQASPRPPFDSTFNLWSSPNGLAWTPVDLGVESYEVRDLTYSYNGGALVAVGTTQTFEDGSQAAFWFSNGGIVWDTVRPDDPSSVEPWLAGESAGRVVILGWNRTPDGAASAWIIN